MALDFAAEAYGETRLWVESLGRELKRWACGGRALISSEVESLEAQGNRCEDWSEVRVSEDFLPEGYYDNRLMGRIFLSRQTGCLEVDGLERPCGVEGVTLVDVWVGANVSLRHVDRLQRVMVGVGVKMERVGVILGGEDGPWEPGFSVTIGNEQGGREPWLCPGLDFETVAMRTLEGRSDVTSVELQALMISVASLPFSLLSEGVEISDLIRGEGLCFGPMTQVRGAHTLEKVTTLSARDEQVFIGAGVILKECILHWGSKVEGHVQAHRVWMGEQSVANEGVILSDAVIGSDNHLAKGEVTSSLLGPFTVLHHQSLVIGVIWPEGKGNIGYGANVGSNHTGRAPDQECFPAEGCFFGLDVAIKFPSDFRGSPYTVVASSTKTLPQRLAMPFSLITPLSEFFDGVSPAYNELAPGWMLSQNYYALHRAKMKFESRRRSRRGRLASEPLRLDGLEALTQAHGTLKALGGKVFYTDADAVDLGKNVLTEKNRVRGLGAYKKAIAMILRRERLNGANLERWRTVAETFEVNLDLRACAEDYADDLHGLLVSTKRARQRDVSRGEQVTGNYMDSHGPLDQDPVIEDLEKHYSRFLELR